MQATDFEVKLSRLQKAEYESLIAVKNVRRSGNAAALRHAQQTMVSRHLQIRELVKAEVRKFAGELKLKPAEDNDTKVTQLLKAFVTGTQLQRVFRDTLSEDPHSIRCSKEVILKVLHVLDRMDRRRDLAVLLDHVDPAVRAKAAGFLADMMPDRCIPILREVAKLGRWVEAGSIACMALMSYSDDHPEIKAQS